MRDFNAWLGDFRKSIADYKYYIDFPKVFANVDAVRIELNILNSLIGSHSIESDFENIITRYPETLKCIPILLAKREMDIVAMDQEGQFCYNFAKRNYPVAQYKVFMRKTGLFDLMENHLINNLVDYVTGVETGLDSNGRKNRGGHLMEDLVESYLIEAGLVKEVTYFKEMYIHEIEQKWHVDLSAISNNGSAEKRFDFVIKCPDMIYGIETNFYSSSGSKLNETARSYKTITLETQNLDFFKFVWFTDGQGWLSARNNLKETFDVLDNLYNIKDLEDGVISRLIQR
jgi:type II restriction enzyme